MSHVFGSDNVGTGTLSGWNLIDNSQSDAFERNSGLGPTGNETIASLYDERESGTTTYEASGSSVPTIPATLGADINSRTVTGINVQTSAQARVRMVLTWHRHISPGTHGTLRTVAHGMTVTGGSFGASAFGVSITETDGCYAGNCDITCQHEDAPGALGHTIVGENYDGKIQIEVTATGEVSTTLSGYDMVALDTPQSNTQHKRQTVKFIKALALA